MTERGKEKNNRVDHSRWCDSKLSQNFVQLHLLNKLIYFALVCFIIQMRPMPLLMSHDTIWFFQQRVSSLPVTRKQKARTREIKRNVCVLKAMDFEGSNVYQWSGRIQIKKHDTCRQL